MFYKKDKICIFIVLLVLFYNFLNYLAICSRLLDIIITIFDKREIHIDFVSRKKDYLKSYCGWNLAVWSRIRCKILIRIKIINISFRFGYFFYLSINKVSNMFFFIFASFFPVDPDLKRWLWQYLCDWFLNVFNILGSIISNCNNLCLKGRYFLNNVSQKSAKSEKLSILWYVE